MKFIPTAQARGLQIDEPVYTIDSSGQYGVGKLVKVEKTASGTVHTFEMARFSANEPSIKTDIEYVSIFKNRV